MKAEGSSSTVEDSNPNQLCMKRLLQDDQNSSNRTPYERYSIYIATSIHQVDQS